jgi:hypothetical protein
MNDEPYSAEDKTVIVEQECGISILASNIEVVKRKWQDEDYCNYRNDRKQICKDIYRMYEPAHAKFRELNSDIPSLIMNQSASKCSERFETSEIIKLKSLGIFLSLSEDIFKPKFVKENVLNNIQTRLKNIQLTRKYTADHINIVVDISANTIRKIADATACSCAIEKTIYKIWLAQKIITDDPLEDLLTYWIDITKRHCHPIIEAHIQSKNQKQLVRLAAKRQKAKAESMSTTHEILGMEDLPED